MKNKCLSVFRNLSGILLLTFLGFQLSAQTSFAGSWSLNESKSNMGEGRFRRAASAMVVAQDAKLLTVESTRAGRDGAETKTTAKYNLDGSVSENEARNSTRKTTLTWSTDKTALTFNSIMTMEMNGESREVKSSETWKLTDGGKLLLVESIRRGQNGEDVKTTAVYDKK
jgi:hypothetical protein